MPKIVSNKDSKTAVIQRELEIEEERLSQEEKKTKRIFLITAVVFLFLLGNLFYLNYKIIKAKPNITETNSTSNIGISPTPTPSPESSPSPTLTNSTQTVINESGLKEYFISLGSGISSAIDWEDVGGLQTSLDLSTYGNIKEVRFEASVQVPTANQAVSVRLFNKTDKHPVWNSEVAMNSGAADYLVSSPIIFDNGKKTYQVQMKTQLGTAANLGQSRLHIVLE